MKLIAHTEITNVNYDVLLTVHLKIILKTDQHKAQILVLSKVYLQLYMFRALRAHHHDMKIALYSIWYHHTHFFQCDDTRCCIMQLRSPED